MEIKYRGEARPSEVRCGEAWRGKAGLGKDTLGMVYNCPHIVISYPFKSDGDQISHRGAAGSGRARHGKAWPGTAWHGKARMYIVGSF